MTRRFLIVGYVNVSFIFVQAREGNRIAAIYKVGSAYEEAVIFEMLLVLMFLACIIPNVAAEDIRATLEPYYKELEEAVETRNISKAVELYHSQGVIVKKGQYVVYGKDGITKDYKVVWEKLGRHTLRITFYLCPSISLFQLSNQSYQGTDDYKIAEFDFKILKEQVPKTVEGSMLHIWKKDGEKLRIYHEQFEVKRYY
ncbi:unnamed protein product [Haemonchus placei]|uniref:DUF3859 domain-containing protein n=1 Tax=Haemonchus placei TaxID=6290 RepID=A0A0N4X728_HAEPC|nr:unnamed protein product [Haemonchus placei]